MPQGLPRLALPHRLYRRVEETAQRWGIDPADVVELQLAAGLPPGERGAGSPSTEGRCSEGEAVVATRLCSRFEAGEALELTPLAARLATHKVGLLRMGPIVSEGVNRLKQPDAQDVPREDLPLEHPASGYPRRWIGMAVDDSPLEVWQAARGYWRAKKDLRYLVPTRFGYAPYVFKVERWAQYNATKLYAAGGWLVYPEAGSRRRLLEPEEGSHLPTLGEPELADDADLEVAGALAGRLLRLGNRGTNPVIRL